MDFRFDDEQVALRDAIRALCQQHFPVANIGDREATAADTVTWRALADMGVFGLLLPPSSGGSGAGAIEAALVFEQLGAHVATGPLLWSTIAAPLLPDVATGAIRVTGIDLIDVAGGPFVVEHAAGVRRRPRRRRTTVSKRSQPPRSSSRWTANRSIR